MNDDQFHASCDDFSVIGPKQTEPKRDRSIQVQVHRYGDTTSLTMLFSLAPSQAKQLAKWLAEAAASAEVTL